jgi:5'-3' exonuclease, N-terminal resolvase-like domain/T4 RNase H, C terminal
VIVIDYSQTAISNLMAELQGRTDVEINLPLLRHMIVNSIRGYKKKFGEQYGDMVLACDSKNYWRKEIFPFYKKHRKKDREESGFDWKAIFEALDTIRDEIKNFFPYKVMWVEGAEADDIIAVLAKYSQQTLSENPLFSEPEPFLVISGDHDFVQLQKYANVKQFSPTQKKFVVPDSTPERALLEHIIRGDKGDGIPNVLSPDQSVYENIRQRPITSKKIDEWSDINRRPQDLEFSARWIRNQTLVDFDHIPAKVTDDILNTYLALPDKDRSKLFNYFINNKMKNMMELIEEF